MTKLNWDRHQRAIFANVVEGTGHVVVNAVAGSGKTTTIVEASKHIPSDQKILYLAFANLNAQDLRDQFVEVPNVEVLTTHAYGLWAVTASRGRLKRSKHRVARFCDDLHDGRIGSERKAGLIQAVRLAKYTLAQTAAEIDEIVDSFNIHVADTVDIGDDVAVDARALFIADVLKLLEMSKSTRDGCLDFDDMIWLPVIKKMAQRKFDWVFIDEVQDLSRTQIELALRAVRSNGRIIAVGDPRQAIYGFRGADQHAFERVKTRLAATELPLSVSYRCCRAVVEEARTIVPTIEAAPEAEDGRVRECGVAELIAQARPGDFILSRSNAPLTELAFRLLDEDHPVHIMGGDIGEGLLAIVDKLKSESVEELRADIRVWAKKEHTRLMKKERDTRVVLDRARCLLVISGNSDTVEDVRDHIERLFVDIADENRIVLGTTHKAKGRERDRVWVLNPTYRLRPGIEEDNLYYVAVTRAKRELCVVTDYPCYKKKDEGESDEL